jgi:hypothetical protein
VALPYICALFEHKRAMNKVLIILLAAMIAASCNKCQNTSSTTENPATIQTTAVVGNTSSKGEGWPYEGNAGDVRFESRTIEKTSCLAPDSCTEFRMVYPVFSLGNEQVRKYLNASIKNYYQMMVGYYYNENMLIENMLDTIGTNFIASFDTAKVNRPGQLWIYEIVTRLPLANENYLTLHAKTRFYNGDSPQNNVVGLTTFDMKTGLPMRPGLILKDSAAVKGLIDKAYRKARDIAPTASLKPTLRQEFDGKLPFPLNYGVLNEGIYFRYNNFEVTPMQDPGAVDILLTWEELGKYADKSRFIK